MQTDTLGDYLSRYGDGIKDSKLKSTYQFALYNWTEGRNRAPAENAEEENILKSMDICLYFQDLITIDQTWFSQNQKNEAKAIVRNVFGRIDVKNLPDKYKDNYRDMTLVLRSSLLDPTATSSSRTASTTTRSAKTTTTKPAATTTAKPVATTAKSVATTTRPAKTTTTKPAATTTAKPVTTPAKSVATTTRPAKTTTTKPAAATTAKPVTTPAKSVATTTTKPVATTTANTNTVPAAENFYESLNKKLSGAYKNLHNLLKEKRHPIDTHTLRSYALTINNETTKQQKSGVVSVENIERQLAEIKFFMHKVNEYKENLKREREDPALPFGYDFNGDDINMKIENVEAAYWHLRRAYSTLIVEKVKKDPH